MRTRTYFMDAPSVQRSLLVNRGDEKAAIEGGEMIEDASPFLREMRPEQRLCSTDYRIRKVWRRKHHDSQVNSLMQYSGCRYNKMFHQHSVFNTGLFLKQFWNFLLTFMRLLV